MAFFSRILKIKTPINECLATHNTSFVRVYIYRGHTSYDKERKRPVEADEFRVLQILPKKREYVQRKGQIIYKTTPPRSEKMAVDQDWMSVWPGPRTFHPASVPLPVRQGYSPKGAPPSKFGNAELMKIPNFLHLTPPAISKHCEALKQYCTPWPEGLETEEDMDQHFPINIIATDYCHSSPTVRDPKSRVVSLKVKLKSLELDEHAKDKLLRLVNERYDEETDVLTFTTDNCPLRKQNYDYAQYLLAACYHEAWNTEPWESEKTEDDQEKYVWPERPASKSAQRTFEYNGRSPPDFKSLAESVERIFNEGESLESLEEYKKNVINIFHANAKI